MKKLLQKYTDNHFLINEIYTEIQKKYSAKNRYYHNLNHIFKMLETIKKFENSCFFTDNIYFATWFHDLIYNPLRKDNEKKSADFSGKILKKLNNKKININIIKHLINRTKNHFYHTENESEELKLFLDADIETLGSESKIYIENTKKIRKEFKIIPDVIFNKGRAEILNMFLKTKYIYRTEYFINKYEKQARKNIKNELSKL